MYVITGGAGFIGSNIAASLDDDGADIVIVDWLGSDDFKWRNVAKRRVRDIVMPEALFPFLEANAKDIQGIVHMGAISTTTERDVDAIVRNNFRLSVDIWNFAVCAGIPLVYASSAATYGDGTEGFVDHEDEAHLVRLRPLNAYGWSKHVFDRWVARTLEKGDPTPPRWFGLKFFNVYGPNEYHKGGQRSVAVQLHAQIREKGMVRLFRSDNPDYADGAQLRDFVWVGDCVDVARWGLEQKAAPSGLYNVGSGKARSFRDKAEVIFRELGVEPHIEFIDLPDALKGKYQYFTEASQDKLRAAGFSKQGTTLELGLRQYVHGYLNGDQFR